MAKTQNHHNRLRGGDTASLWTLSGLVLAACGGGGGGAASNDGGNNGNLRISGLPGTFSLSASMQIAPAENIYGALAFAPVSTPIPEGYTIPANDEITLVGAGGFRSDAWVGEYVDARVPSDDRDNVRVEISELKISLNNNHPADVATALSSTEHISSITFRGQVLNDGRFEVEIHPATEAITIRLPIDSRNEQTRTIIVTDTPQGKRYGQDWASLDSKARDLFNAIHGDMDAIGTPEIILMTDADGSGGMTIGDTLSVSTANIQDANDPNPLFAFQWYRDNAVLNGEESRTITPDMTGRYHVVVMVTDDGHPGSTANFPPATTTLTSDSVSVAVLPQPNRPPDISGDVAGEVAEDGVLTDSGTLAHGDDDTGQTILWRVDTASGGGFSGTSAASTYGTFSITQNGVWSYRLDNTAAQPLTTAGTTETFYVRADDGQGESNSTDIQAITITIGGAAEPTHIRQGNTAQASLADYIINDANPSRSGNLNLYHDTANTPLAENIGSYRVIGNTPTGFTLNAASGAWSYAPTRPQDGATISDRQIVIGFTPSDTTAHTAPINFTLQFDITNPPVPPGSGGAVVLSDSNTDTDTLTPGQQLGYALAATAISGNITAMGGGNDLADAGDYTATNASRGTFRFTNEAIGAWQYVFGGTRNEAGQIPLTDNVTVTFAPDNTLYADGTIVFEFIIANLNNRPPDITGEFTGEVAEDGVLTDSGALAHGDDDASQTNLWRVDTASGGSFGSTSIASTYGTFSITQNGVWTYRLDNTAAQPLTTAGTAETFYVRADDGQGEANSTDVQAITINIGGADEPTSAPDPITLSAESIFENHPTNKAVHDFDPPTGLSGTWSLPASTATSLNDNAKFTIDAMTGKLWWKASPDFEAAGDHDTNNTYQVEAHLTAESGAKHEYLLPVMVNDLENEIPPSSYKTNSARILRFEKSEIRDDDLPGDYAQHLIGGIVWKMPTAGPLTLTWGFALSPPSNTNDPAYYYDEENNFLKTQADIESARGRVDYGLGLFESATNIKFVEVRNDATIKPDIVLFLHEGETIVSKGGFYGYSTGPNDNQETVVAARDDGLDNNFVFGTFLHEMGHTLGLKHPFASQFGTHKGGFPEIFAYNSGSGSELSMMSLNREIYPRLEEGLLNADIEALQYLYGAPDTDFAGIQLRLARGPISDVVDAYSGGGQGFIEENWPNGRFGTRSPDASGQFEVGNGQVDRATNYEVSRFEVANYVQGNDTANGNKGASVEGFYGTLYHKTDGSWTYELDRDLTALDYLGRFSGKERFSVKAIEGDEKSPSDFDFDITIQGYAGPDPDPDANDRVPTYVNDGIGYVYWVIARESDHKADSHIIHPANLFVADHPDAVLTYALGGEDADLFRIDESTGEVRFISDESIDRDHPDLANGFFTFDIIATATHSTGTQMASRKVFVEIAPSLSAPSGSEGAHIHAYSDVCGCSCCSQSREPEIRDALYETPGDEDSDGAASPAGDFA